MSLIAAYELHLSEHARNELIAAFCHPEFRMLVACTIKDVEQQILNLGETDSDEEVGRSYKTLKHQLATYRELEELIQLSQQRIESWQEN